MNMLVVAIASAAYGIFVGLTLREPPPTGYEARVQECQQAVLKMPGTGGVNVEQKLFRLCKAAPISTLNHLQYAYDPQRIEKCKKGKNGCSPMSYVVEELYKRRLETP